MKYQRLRDLREDRDLTQNQLVEILGMHKTTYTNYEQGKLEIPFSLAIRLAELYNVSLDYLAGLISEPRPCIRAKEKNDDPLSPCPESGDRHFDLFRFKRMPY